MTKPLKSSDSALEGFHPVDISGQKHPHEDVLIRLTPESRKSLISALRNAVPGEKSVSCRFFDSNGEGFDIRVVVAEYDPKSPQWKGSHYCGDDFGGDRSREFFEVFYLGMDK